MKKIRGLIPEARYCRDVIEKATEEPPETPLDAVKERQRAKGE